MDSGLCSPQIAQPVPQEIRLLGFHLHQDPCRDGLHGINPLQHRSQHRAVERLNIVQNIFVTVHHAAVAHDQAVHAGTTIQHRRSIEIRVLLIGTGRLLPREPGIQLLQRVAVAGRQLKGRYFRGLPHGRFQS